MAPCVQRDHPHPRRFPPSCDHAEDPKPAPTSRIELAHLHHSTTTRRHHVQPGESTRARNCERCRSLLKTMVKWCPCGASHRSRLPHETPGLSPTRLPSSYVRHRIPPHPDQRNRESSSVWMQPAMRGHLPGSTKARPTGENQKGQRVLQESAASIWFSQGRISQSDWCGYISNRTLSRSLPENNIFRSRCSVFRGKQKYRVGCARPAAGAQPPLYGFP